MARTSREERAAAAAETASKLAELTKDKPVEQEPVSQEQVEKRDDEPARTIKPRNEPRERGMDEIIARREKPPAETETPEETPLEDAITETPAETPVETPIEKKTVKVKVDGEEFEVPQEEVDAAGGVGIYQRERAADNRLKKTNEALAETRRVQAQMAEWMTKNTPKQPTQTDEQFITERMDTMRFGSPEDSAKAMREILSHNRQQIDPNMVTAMAVSQINEGMAIKEFDREFADVGKNPLLLKLAATLVQERKRQLKQIPDWSNFYRSIGNEVRSVTGRPNQPPAAQVTDGKTSQPDKEARKASIVNLPTAASRAALPEATKPETREDVLDSMRKRRGIPTG